MDRYLKDWVIQNGCKGYRSCLFCQNVGIVASGVKPAEIINIAEDDYRNCKALKDFVKLKVITSREGTLKVFIYNEVSLYEILQDEGVKRLLMKLGYHDVASVDRTIDHLIDRIINHNDDFPHEIGIFLGYPLKDVLGYMGIGTLPYIKTLGWKMYGDITTSENIYRKRRAAKRKIGSIINQTKSLTV